MIPILCSLITGGGGFMDGCIDGLGISSSPGIPSSSNHEIVVEAREPQIILEIEQNEEVTNGSGAQKQIVKVYGEIIE
jgi:hypothetical protein